MKKCIVLVVVVLASVFSVVVLASYAKGLDAEQRGDYQTAIHEYMPLAKAGNVEAQLNLGYIYASFFNDFKQAHYWYSQAAKQNDPKAFASLGLFYWAGTGVARDTVKAKHYLLRAAQAGNVYGMSNLGVVLLSNPVGHGDIQQGLHWMVLAADRGDAVALYNMGLFYSTGRYVGKDVLRAVQYYTKAAMLGEGEAMTNLGLLYERGDGPQLQSNYPQAYHWLSLAALQGSVEARKALKALKKKMTPAQIADADKALHGYLQKNVSASI